MKLLNQKITWVILLVILGIASVTAVVIADPEITWPWSSEPGTVEPGVKEQDVGEPLPDEDGYTGPLPEVQSIEVPSGSETESGVQPDWDAILTEPQPDEDDGTSLRDGGLRWSNFYYAHSAGSVLKPRNSSVEWSTDGSGGCVYLSSGSASTILNLHLDIPNGARIDYLRIYYYDTDAANNSTAWITSYDDEGGLVDITNVSSAGSSGYGTQLSPLVEHVVDNVYHSYVLNWRPYATGSSMALCGLRVAYRLP